MRSVLFALLLVANAAFGQQPRFSVGLKAGAGFSGSFRKQFLENNPPLSVSTDQYRPRLSYAAGLRLNYRLTKRLALTLDAEYQRLRDQRTGYWEFLANGAERFEYTNRYQNDFYRLQTPLTIRYDVWRAENRALYLRGGVQYALLFGGHTDYVFSSNKPQTHPDQARSYNIPLAIPANRHLRTAWQPVAGVGWQLSQHLALELTGQFGEKLSYTLFDPGFTDILPPNDRSWASRSLLLSAVVSVGKP